MPRLLPGEMLLKLRFDWHINIVDSKAASLSNNVCKYHKFLEEEKGTSTLFIMYSEKRTKQAKTRKG